MGKAMCTETAREMDMLRRRLAGTEAQLAKATQNMRLLEEARREAFKAGYFAGRRGEDLRQAMLSNDVIPLDA